MVKKLLKQAVGIDVSQNTLDVSLGRMDEQAATEVYAYKSFKNTELGFMSLILWVKKNTAECLPPLFIMEATGVYHEKLAYFLSGKGHAVSIVMPNKTSNFFKTMEGKTVTDKAMSAVIAMSGLEKNPGAWVPAKKVYRELRQVTRERDQLVGERVTVKNQMHAEGAEAYPNAQTIVRGKERIKMLNNQILQIMGEIGATVKNDAEVARSMALITTIPGVGVLTGAIILAETDGFSLIKSRRQLTSYSGLDVKLKDSGTSVHAKPRISKRGNKYLRKAMHMPALTAIKHTKEYKDLFIRIVGKTGVKMKAVVAVQRKVLELAYTIHKTQKPYEINYEENRAKKKLEPKQQLEHAA